MPDATTALLAERAKTHGDFHDHARITQRLKDLVAIELEDRIFCPEHNEALDMILHKIGRIVVGNPNHRDHWDDIAGYARLASEACDDPTP